MRFKHLPFHKVLFHSPGLLIAGCPGLSGYVRSKYPLARNVAEGSVFVVMGIFVILPVIY